VLPIGGVKEKVLGAHRAGITTVILPKANEADLEDVPADVREGMRFHAVETLREVLAIALVPVVGGSAAEDGDGRRLPGSAGREALAGV
jgi:ATP-dependent Lon protease